MSIISDTLDRLEKDSHALLDGAVPIGAIAHTRNGMGTLVKALAAILLVVFAGTGLLVWNTGDMQAGRGESKAVGEPRDTSPANNAALMVFNRAEDFGAVGHSVQGRQSPTEQPSETPPETNRKPDSEPKPEPRQEAKSQPKPEPGRETRSQPKPKPGPAPAASRRPGPVATVRPAPSAVVDEAVEQARLALSRGLYQQALGALTELQPAPERRADYWLIKGSAHLGLGELGMAESSFAAAHSLTPGNVQIAIQRAIIKQEYGDHAGALKILQEAAVQHGDVPEVYLNQGYSQQALGAVREAESSFRIFLRLTEGRSLYRQQRNAIEQWLAQFLATRT